MSDEQRAAPGLDDLLDSVHDFALVYSLWWDIEAGFDGDDRHEGQWCAQVEWPLAAQWEPLVSIGSAEGTGPTRMAAIADAVAKAKKEVKP